MREWIAAIALLATGCATGPAYQRPAALPDRARATFMAGASWVDPLAPLPDRWWRLYDDAVLDDLIARAFAANTDIRVAVANLERARGIADEARGARTPTVGVAGSVSQGRGATGAGQFTLPVGGSGSYLSYGAGAAASWELDLFGRVRSSIAAAIADVQATEAARDGVRTTVAAETARAYLASCALAETVAILDESVDNNVRTLTSTGDRARVGSMAALDVDRVAVDAATTRAARIDAEGRREIAVLELTALIGARPGGLPAPAAACRHLPDLSGRLPIDTIGALLRRRPDIRAAERRLAADTARIGVATAALYPQFSLVGSAGNFGDRSTNRTNLFTFALGPLFSWTFPNQGIARARIRQANAQAQVSLAQFDGAVLQATKEVERSLTSYAAEQSRNRALDEARVRAEAAFRRVGHRQRLGVISFLDLLIAQRDWIAARSAYAASRELLASREIDLFRALGGGWADAAAGDVAARSEPR